MYETYSMWQWGDRFRSRSAMSSPWNNCRHLVHNAACHIQLIGLREKNQENPIYISWENLWFPVDFPSSQPSDTYCPSETWATDISGAARSCSSMAWAIAGWFQPGLSSEKLRVHWTIWEIVQLQLQMYILNIYSICSTTSQIDSSCSYVFMYC